MNKTLLIFALAALAACSSTDLVPDEFTLVAEEWQGGDIQEMINVWGDPKSLKQAGTDGEDGVAQWRYVFGGTSSNAGRSTRRSRCEVTAYFNASGFISEIEASTQKCNIREVRLERLRRP